MDETTTEERGDPTPGAPDAGTDADDEHQAADGGAPRKGDDDVLVEALATGLSNTRAGRLAGMSERTVRRRRQEPPIVRQVAERRLEISQQATARMGTLYTDAIDTIEDVMVDGTARERLAAAKLLLQTGPNLRAQTEFEERLHTLERDLSGEVDADPVEAGRTGWPGELR
jgi:hypothetical protein